MSGHDPAAPPSGSPSNTCRSSDGQIRGLDDNIAELDGRFAELKQDKASYEAHRVEAVRLRERMTR